MGQVFCKVNLSTKPYIKHYLEHHFGNPVVIPSGHFISEYLITLLGRPLKEDNERCKTYSERISIGISDKVFKRYGFGLTKTNAKNFNSAMENFIRSQIRAIAQNILDNHNVNEDWKGRYEKLRKEHNELLKITAENITPETIKKLRRFEALMNKRIQEYNNYKVKLNDALMMAAYDCMGFDEQILPFETIRKDFYRYKIRQKP